MATAQPYTLTDRASSRHYGGRSLLLQDSDGSVVLGSAGCMSFTRPCISIVSAE
jgi:hypothetical protein